MKQFPNIYHGLWFCGSTHALFPNSQNNACILQVRGSNHVQVFCCCTRMLGSKPGCVSFHLVFILVDLTQFRELSMGVGRCPTIFQQTQNWVRFPPQETLPPHSCIPYRPFPCCTPRHRTAPLERSEWAHRPPTFQARWASGSPSSPRPRKTAPEALVSSMQAHLTPSQARL